MRLQTIAAVATAAARRASRPRSRPRRPGTPSRPPIGTRCTTVSTPSLSPDGGKVAITVTTVRESENSATPRSGSCRRRAASRRATRRRRSRARTRASRKTARFSTSRRSARGCAAAIGRCAWINRRAKHISPIGRRAFQRIAARGQELHRIAARCAAVVAAEVVVAEGAVVAADEADSGARLGECANDPYAHMRRSRARRTTRSRSRRIPRASTASRSSTWRTR